MKNCSWYDNFVFLLVSAKVVFDTYFVQMERIEVPINLLPPAFDGWRILQISDLHGRRLSADGQIVKQIKAANPDVIVLTGDYV